MGVKLIFIYYVIIKMEYGLESYYPNTLKKLTGLPMLRGIPCCIETAQEVEKTLTDIRVLEVTMILQEINNERKQEGEKVVEINKDLLDLISRNMNDFEKTLNEFKKVEIEIYDFIESCNKFNQESFNWNNPDNMNLKELYVMSKNRYNPLLDDIKETAWKHEELREKFKDQFGKIERIMLDKFRIWRDDGVFRKIFEIRFGVDYNYNPAREDILTRKTLYEIAEVNGANAEVYPKELKICWWDKWWPKYEIPFNLSCINWESEKCKIIIAINRGRDLCFRLRFNQKVFKHLMDTFDQRNSKITFYNGKVVLKDDKKEGDITKYLY